MGAMGAIGARLCSDLWDDPVIETTGLSFTRYVYGVLALAGACEFRAENPRAL